MATPLPLQGKILAASEWSFSTAKLTMNVGGYEASTTPFRPTTTSVTLTWIVNSDELNTLLAEFNSTAFNGEYLYTHANRGNLLLRPTGEGSFPEIKPGRKARFSMGFKVV